MDNIVIGSRHLPNRREFVAEFYDILGLAEDKFGLWDYDRFDQRSSNFPEAGVYFFYEPGERRQRIEDGWRVVRVGTHRVGEGGKATFASRIRNHFGAAKTFIGRSSIFRDHVGAALFGRSEWETHGEEVSSQRHKIVSTYMRSLEFVFIPVDDPSSSTSERRLIEMGAVALLSNYGVPKSERIDPPSDQWLGLRCQTKKAPHDHVSQSGLWNIDGVNAEYDPLFLSIMRRRVND